MGLFLKNFKNYLIMKLFAFFVATASACFYEAKSACICPQSFTAAEKDGSYICFYSSNAKQTYDTASETCGDMNAKFPAIHDQDDANFYSTLGPEGDKWIQGKRRAWPNRKWRDWNN